MTQPEIKVLDLRGLKCPLPVLRARKQLHAMANGQHLRVLTTDALAVIDIPHMCFEDGHRAGSPVATEDGHMFLITVGDGRD
jgi:tRNA 2-thiouridine synthesizing protein A